jgi:prevent-host-death family protein
MTRKVSAHIARTQFGQIMDRAIDHDERFLIERNGEPAVLIMSVADYIKSIAPEDPALKEIRNNAKRVGLDKLTMEEIDAEIASHRGEKKDKQSQPGRGQ